MPEFVRVKSKETGAEFTIDAINVNDTVTVLDEPAVGVGPLLPKSNVSPKSASAPSRNVDPDVAIVGDSGKSKEGSK